MQGPAVLLLLALLLLAACSGSPAVRTGGPGSRPAPDGFPGPGSATTPGTAVPAAPPAPEAACSLSLLGRGPLVLPSGLAVDGLDVGGLSAIAYLGGDRYLALTDNQKGTPARLFALEFAMGPDGPAPPPGKTARDVVVGATRLQGFDGGNLDGEGLAVTPWDNLLVASETEPSIRELDREGRLVGTLEVPKELLKKGGRGIGGNLGFESLALSPEGDVLWTGTERALRRDAPGAGQTEASLSRLLRYRRTPDGFVPDGQLVYPIEAVANPGRGRFAVRGLSELLALPGGGLLALEREFVMGRGNRIQVFEMSAAALAEARDVSGLDSLAGLPAGELRPVRKTLLFDFAAAGFAPDNVEGMTLGPTLPEGDRTVVLVSDDNFMPVVQATQLIALRLRCPSPADPH